MSPRHLSKCLLSVALLAAIGVTSPALAISPYETANASSRGYQRTSGRQNPALEFFAGQRPYFQAASQPVRPAPMAAAPRVATQRGKPFAAVQQQPTITPYLALDVPTSEETLPNYYAFVRPQLEQQQRNQVQQAQYLRLQHQVNTAISGPTRTDGALPTTGHSTQFMNPGGYYRTLR